MKASSDQKREGLQLEMHGGEYQKQKQKAVVEFLCQNEASDKFRREQKDADVKEGEEGSEDEDDDDDKDGQIVEDGHGGTLQYKSWGIEGGTKVLRLDWQTKYACEDSSSSSDSSKSGHWGFFTWFIIM